MPRLADYMSKLLIQAEKGGHEVTLVLVEFPIPGLEKVSSKETVGHSLRIALPIAGSAWRHMSIFNFAETDATLIAV